MNVVIIQFLHYVKEGPVAMCALLGNIDFLVFLNFDFLAEFSKFCFGGFFGSMAVSRAMVVKRVCLSSECEAVRTEHVVQTFATPSG